MSVAKTARRRIETFCDVRRDTFYFTLTEHRFGRLRDAAKGGTCKGLVSKGKPVVRRGRKASGLGKRDSGVAGKSDDLTPIGRQTMVGR